MTANPPPTEPTETIVLNGVTVAYPSPGRDARTVLSGIDLTIPAGEFTALVGRSGCEKTTLLNLVAGLVSPCVGSVTVLGTEPRQARRRTEGAAG